MTLADYLYSIPLDALTAGEERTLDAMIADEVAAELAVQAWFCASLGHEPPSTTLDGDDYCTRCGTPLPEPKASLR